MGTETTQKTLPIPEEQSFYILITKKTVSRPNDFETEYEGHDKRCVTSRSNAYATENEAHLKAIELIKNGKAPEFYVMKCVNVVRKQLNIEIVSLK